VKARALDEWMAHFDIHCLQRHHAAADALATAELLLHLWPRLRAETGGRLSALARLEASRRWISGS
jgi:DNA polymerase-3 subunit epsilon